MTKPIIYQKIRKGALEPLEQAFRYYSILSSVNELKLTQRELQLVSFATLKGNISYAPYKEEFCELYKSSLPTITNMISRLKKLKVFIKEKGKIKTNPAIALDFEKNIVLQITLELDGQAK